VTVSVHSLDVTRSSCADDGCHLPQSPT